ncbi:sulfurtransferase [Orrella marina]|uniref:Rhodanese domain-containing protein n=1 Tax=Orrella marina TaxID=2163011 RepID=A0A2R4XLX8_9BURK|nr:rhodanese-like domain-containing protein [Orrella marina]AWB34784.1 hypothetical protein DBV39_14810 [Orrella marina]
MQTGSDVMAQSTYPAMLSMKKVHRPVWTVATLLLIILATQWVTYQGSAYATGSSQAAFSPAAPQGQDDPDLAPESQWVIGPHDALGMIAAGATLLDARTLAARKIWPASLNALPVHWQDFSYKAFQDRGVPLPAQEGAGILHEMAVTSERPVIVLGDWAEGWGEDGRVVWTLRQWGYRQVFMVDGGHAALEKARALGKSSTLVDGMAHQTSHQLPAQKAAQPAQDVAEVSTSQVRELLDHEDIVFLDVREPREYAGATPYGESRGGHLPGAVNVWFKAFLSEEGTLRSASEVHNILVRAGALDASSAQESPMIVVYGSGGFRSAWVAGVLSHYGYDVRHYAGSMWQWSDRPWFWYPLVTASR